MIFKKIKARDASGRYRYRRAAHLMRYVEKLSANAADAADGRQLEAGAAHLRDRGFLDDSDTDAHIAEMQGLIHGCPKARAPTRHYVMSWQNGERPTPAQVDQAVDIFLTEAGWQKHMCRYALHHDTEHAHVHIVVCTIDPATERVRDVRRGLDIEVGHRAIAKIEQAQGWRPEAGAVKRREREAKGEQKPASEPRAIAPEVRACELARGVESATRRAQEAAQALATASSWEQVHTALSLRGLAYQLKGSGAVIRVDTQGQEPVFVKASDVSRSAARASMEKRLGAYQAPRDDLVQIAKAAAPEQRPAPTPDRPAARLWFERRQLWQAYQAERQALRERRAQAYRKSEFQTRLASRLAAAKAAAELDALRRLPLRGPLRRALLDEALAEGRRRARGDQLALASVRRQAIKADPLLADLPRWSEIAAAHARGITLATAATAAQAHAAAVIERLLRDTKKPAGGPAPAPVLAIADGLREEKDVAMWTLDELMPREQLTESILRDFLEKEQARGADGRPEKNELVALEALLGRISDHALDALDDELMRLQKGQQMQSHTNAVIILIQLITLLLRRLFRRGEIEPVRPLPGERTLTPEQAEKRAMLTQARRSVLKVKLARSQTLRALDEQVADAAVTASLKATGQPPAFGASPAEIAAGKRALAEALLAEAAALEARAEAHAELPAGAAQRVPERPRG